MLPCQSECTLHKEGCHKNCTRWQEFQRLQQQDRQKRDPPRQKFYRNLHLLLSPISPQARAQE